MYSDFVILFVIDLQRMESVQQITVSMMLRKQIPWKDCAVQKVGHTKTRRTEITVYFLFITIGQSEKARETEKSI